MRKEILLLIMILYSHMNMVITYKVKGQDGGIFSVMEYPVFLVLIEIKERGRNMALTGLVPIMYFGQRLMLTRKQRITLPLMGICLLGIFLIFLLFSVNSS